MYKKRRLLLVAASFLFTVASAPAQDFDTVRIATYNLMRFSSDESSRIEILRTIFEELDADIVVVQGVASLQGMLHFGSTVASQVFPQLTVTGDFRDKQDSYVVILSAGEQFQLAGQQRIDMPTTDGLLLSLKQNTTGERITIAAVDLTSGESEEKREIRRREVELLDSTIKAREIEGEKVVIAGTLNIRTSSDRAYALLTGGNHFFDPGSQSGEWYNNPAFASLHTSSTRFDLSTGGKSEGLRDRSDYILLSSTLVEHYRQGSYTTFGNDGNHFGDSVNAGINQAVSASLAQALHDASDHLPLYLDLLLPKISSSVDHANILPLPGGLNLE
ncbi:MAG: endonuclease/exonuclease/phosphatase family protein [Candidatus Kapaibacterium sp.]